MKRIVDIAVAILGIIIVWPVVIATMVAIRLESRGPSLLAQARIGRAGRLFICYKLRTMRQGTQQLPTHQVASAALTSLGGFLRRTKLDELPQLFNVLRGEMSLVGPRPCLPSQTELIEERLRSGALNVQPGITGLAQVQGVDMSDPVRLAEIDGLYARTRTFSGDMRLLFLTLTGSGLGRDPAMNTSHRAGGDDRKGHAP